MPAQSFLCHEEVHIHWRRDGQCNTMQQGTRLLPCLHCRNNNTTCSFLCIALSHPKEADQSIQSFVLQGMWSYSFIASCNGLQGDVAQYAANQTRNTGANPFSLRQLHWVLLHELHKTLGPRALYSTRRMQQ